MTGCTKFPSSSFNSPNFGDSAHLWESDTSVKKVVVATKRVFHVGSRITDGLPEDLAPVLPPLWHSFPPQHPFIIYFFSILIFLLLLINLIGNGLVLVIFTTTKELRTPVRTHGRLYTWSESEILLSALQSNLLIVNLALSDLLMMTTMGIPAVVNGFFTHKWIFGPLLCKVYGCCGGIFGQNFFNIHGITFITYQEYQSPNL